MSAANKITTIPPLHALLTPRACCRCGTDWLEKQKKKKIHSTLRQSKSDDITGSKSYLIMVFTLSCRQVQTNIRGFKKYETFMVVGNELHVVMRRRQRSNPSHINPGCTAVESFREGLARTSSGKITFSKK